MELVELAVLGLDVADGAGNRAHDNGFGLNRVLAELSLALSAERAEPQKWSARASLSFIFATCGAFWLAAAVLFYTFH